MPKLDVDLTDQDLAELVRNLQSQSAAVIGTPFPDDAMEQLWGALALFLKSWNGKRAVILSPD